MRNQKVLSRVFFFLFLFFLFFVFWEFLVDAGIYDPNTTIRGASSTRQRNAIEIAFRRRADDDPY